VSDEPTQIWSRAAQALVSTLDAPLRALGGEGWSLRSGEVRFLDCVDLRSSLPKSGCGIFVAEDERRAAEGMLVFIPGEVTSDLGRAIEGRGSDEWLALFATGLGHLAGQVFGEDSPLATPRTTRLDESVWEGEVDPLAPGRLCVAEIEIVPGGPAKGRPLGLRFLASEEALAGPLAALASFDAAGMSAAGSSSGRAQTAIVEHEHLLLLRADPELEARLARSLGEAGDLRRVKEISDLVSAFGTPEVTGAVVEIREGRDYLLPLLRGLKDFPGCEAKPLLVILDPAESWRVRECARLGLWAVLDRNFGEPDIERRLHEERTINAPPRS
jgi:hypothetical protein